MEQENDATRPGLFDDNDEEEYKPEVPAASDEVANTEATSNIPEAESAPVSTEVPVAEGTPVIEEENKVEVQEPIVTDEPKKVEEPSAPTDAELKHNEEAERAKTQLLAQITEFKPEDDLIDAATDAFEQEDYNPREASFSVTEPVKISGTVKYTVKGIDDDGEFTIQRRFKEFYALSVQLRTRWPGCFIPAIPEKKIFNNSDTEVVDERRQLLEKFLKDCSRFDYIIFSKEFKLFSRGQGEIDKALNQLPKQSPMQVLEKYRLNFQIDEQNTSQEKLQTFSDNIQRFMNFLKKAIPSMQMQKRSSKGMSNIREDHDKGQTKLMKALMKYEDVGIAFYAFDDPNMRVLTHPNNEELTKELEKAEKAQRNPYRDSYIWIKGEYLDLQGMLDCLQGREIVMKHQLDAEKKIVADQGRHDTLKAGKTTMTNFFKSKATKQSDALKLESVIQNSKQEVDDFKQLINFLTIYHGQIAIPRFKRTKAQLYLKLLNSFCMKEIANAHVTATVYHSLLDLEKSTDKADVEEKTAEQEAPQAEAEQKAEELVESSEPAATEEQPPVESVDQLAEVAE